MAAGSIKMMATCDMKVFPDWSVKYTKVAISQQRNV